MAEDVSTFGNADFLLIPARQVLPFRLALEPHSAGGFTQHAGGMYLPIVLNTRPMTLSVVQFALPSRMWRKPCIMRLH